MRYVELLDSYLDGEEEDTPAYAKAWERKQGEALGMDYAFWRETVAKNPFPEDPPLYMVELTIAPGATHDEASEEVAAYILGEVGDHFFEASEYGTKIAYRVEDRRDSEELAKALEEELKDVLGKISISVRPVGRVGI